MAGREDYEERKQRRIDHYKEKAERANAASNTAYQQSHEIISHIPMGQPILIGHHSEGRHRRDLQRSDNLMHKAVALDEKADYYQNKAGAAASNTAISADDPQAIEKLTKKIKMLEATQKEWKEQNKHYKKHGTMKGFSGLSDEEAAQMDSHITKYHYGQAPAPAWMLQNNNAEIRRLKQRVEQLQKIEATEPQTIHFDGGKILENEEENRTQILFDEIPGEEVRKDLKAWGFKWSRYNKAWQRIRTPQATRAARRIIESHYTI